VTNFYIYYRVDATRLEGIGLSVQKLFKTIENETGIRGRWMRRRDDPTTYMEVYEGVTDDLAFESLLARAAAELGPHLPLPRRVERFVCA
jgi:hypothetical protein